MEPCVGRSSVGLGFGGTYSPLSWVVDVVDLGDEHVSFKEGLDFVSKEALQDLRNGEAPVSDLEVCASTTTQNNNNTSLESGAYERFRVWNVTLKNLQKKL